MSDTQRYRSRDTGEKIEAVIVPEGGSVMHRDIEGFRKRAEVGQYLIVHPYHEAVDPESFEWEYEIIEPKENIL
jgi:hypothetical protein